MTRPRLSLRALSGRASFWIALVAGLAAAFMLTAGVVELQHGAILARDGVDTQATITGFHTSLSRRAHGSSRTRHAVDLSFVGPGGQTLSARKGISASERDAMRTGQRLPMRYSAARPDLVELHPGDIWWGGLKALLLGFASLLGALWAVYALLRSLGAQRRAARLGTGHRAQVIAHHRTGKGPAAKVEVAYVLDGVTGRTAPLSARRAPALGSEIGVWIDPVTGRGWWSGEF